MSTRTVPKRPAKVQELRPELSKEYLDVEELAARLKIGRTKVFELISKEGLPCIRLGHQTLRFDPGDVALWLQSQKQQA